MAVMTTSAILSKWARSGRDALRRRVNLWGRKPPAIRVSTSPSELPTIYYLAPDADAPIGGVRVIYRHVDFLNEMGIPAAVLHGSNGVNLTWFRHTTRVESARSLNFKSNDVLVVPEYYGPFLHTLPDEIAKVIFNQTAYHTFDCIDREATLAGAPYAGLANLRGLMTVSQDSRRLLELAFPQLPIRVVRNVVDPILFSPGTARRRRAVAYVPTRREHELGQLLHILRARGFDWDLIPIRGMSETEVAQVLKSTSIFLSLSELEGFGLPAAEAMACGCYVVGYTGGGGEEFFDPACCAPVQSLSELIDALVRATELPQEQLEMFGKGASEGILQRYSQAGMREDLLGFWNTILGNVRDGQEGPVRAGS